MNKALQAKSHLRRNLTAFFIDSFAKMPFNLNDPVQQAAFDKETDRLWNTAFTFDPFEFHTIEDVLNDLDKCQTTLDTDIAELKAGLKEVDTKVGDNEVDISVLQTFTFDINEKVKNHTSDLRGVHKSIVSLDDTDAGFLATVNSMQNSIEENTKLIQKADNVIGDLHLTPIGAIVAWTPRPATNHPNMELPEGWIRCDGQVIPSPSNWAGIRTPDLNSQRRFLRGGNDNQCLTFEEDMFQDHTHLDYGHTHRDAGHLHELSGSTLKYGHDYGDKDGSPHWGRQSPNNDDTVLESHANIQVAHAQIGNPNSGSRGYETRPKNMGVVWIMRIY